MNAVLKKIIFGILVIGAAIAAGYAIRNVYNSAVDDATRRIKEGVKEGVSEGVGEGVGNALNPLNIPKKLFGK